MRTEHRLILQMGRACLKERERLLALPPINPDREKQIDYLYQHDLVVQLWDCYKMVYTRLFGAWPKWQLRFY